MYRRRWDTYKEFLASDDWREMVAQVRIRSKNKCERCEIHPHEATHHLSDGYKDYPYGWQCPIEWLQAVCHGCHDFIHGYSDNDPMDQTLEAMWRRLREVYPSIGMSPEQKRAAEIQAKDTRLQADQDAINEMILEGKEYAAEIKWLENPTGKRLG